MADGWEPANEVEQRLLDAMQRGDQDRYFQVLNETDLLLPVPVDANGQAAPGGWATWAYEGRTYLLAFTSQQAMMATLGQYAGEFRTARLADISAGWPDQSWWLAIDFGLPIAGYLPANFVSQITQVSPSGSPADQQPADQQPNQPEQPAPADERPADGGAAWAPGQAEQPISAPPAEQPQAGQGAGPAAPAGDASGFSPVNETESALLNASTAGDRKVFMDALLASYVLIPVPPGASQATVTDPGFPWASTHRGAQPEVQMFTSTDRLRERVGETGYAVAPFVLVLENWPRSDWSLALNPETPIEATLDGGRVGELANWARETKLAERLGVRPPAPPAAPTSPGPAVRTGPEPTSGGPTGPEPTSGAPAGQEPVPGEYGGEQPPTAETRPDAGPAAETRTDAEAAPTEDAGYGPASTAETSDARASDARTSEAETSEAETSDETGWRATAAGVATPPDAVGEPAGATPPDAVGEPASGTAPVDGGQPPDSRSPEGEDEAPEWPPVPPPEPQQPAMPQLSFPAVLQKPVPDDQVTFYLERHFDRVGGYVHPVANAPGSADDLRRAADLGGTGGTPVHAIRWAVESEQLVPLLGATRSEAEPEFVEYRIASTRLPHGAELYQIGSDATTQVIAVYDADQHRWHPLT